MSMKHKKCTLTLFLCVISIICYSQNIGDVYSNAITERENGNYEKAIKIIDTGLGLDSMNYLLYLEKSKCYFFSQKLDLALHEINKAIQINPSNYESYYNRSILYYNLGNTQASLTDITSAIKISEKQNIRYSVFYGLRGTLYVSLGDYKKAEKDLLIGLQNEPENIDMLNNYSIIYMHKKQYIEAKKILDLLYEKNPDNFYIINNLAYVTIELHNYDEAIRLCDKGIELVVNDTVFQSFLYNNKGYALYYLERFDEALIFINEAIDCNKQNSYAFKNRSLVYVKTNKQNDACIDINNAIELGYIKQYGKDIVKLKEQLCK